MNFAVHKSMAWGLWNKIKQGFKKAGNFVKNKVLKPVVNKVIKPFKPIIGGVASAINPKAGAFINTAMNVAERWSDEGDSAIKDDMQSAVSWAKDRWG